MLSIDEFRKQFSEIVTKNGVQWKVKGFYADDGRIYSIGTDTKVLSTIFETLAAPFITEIALKNGYEVSSSKQTVYPDFTLTPNGKTNNRIAIDIKTTYQRPPNGDLVFTLGSYTSFIRNGTKNISFPYDEYSGHWILGFVYSRLIDVESKVYNSSEEAKDIVCPYQDVQYFIQDKYKIAGLKPGSGNTTNIGSFHTRNIDDLREGRGPFSKLGEDEFIKYWRKYIKKRRK